MRKKILGMILFIIGLVYSSVALFTANIKGNYDEIVRNLLAVGMLSFFLVFFALMLLGAVILIMQTKSKKE